jgi:ribosomal protein S18 acetylase RimI-like enzyme
VKQVLIRRAVESDVQPICRLQRQWFEEGDVYGLRPESREQIEAALGPYLLVAEVDHEIVGFISGSAHISEGTAVIPAGESYIEITNLYTSPGCRRQGVGSGLIAQLLARAKEAGVAYALLYSAAKDIQRVLRFYEEHRFQSWYVQMFRKL